jgi:hypothetical protein
VVVGVMKKNDWYDDWFTGPPDPVGADVGEAFNFGLRYIVYLFLLVGAVCRLFKIS